MGSKAGVMKVAAGRIGLTIKQYQEKMAQGLKWCWKCRKWKPRSEFDHDPSRSDGLSAVCYDCNRQERTKPSKRMRREMHTKHLAWCSGCKRWFPLEEIRGGHCRSCGNAYARKRYATSIKYREERKNHRDKHRRGVERVPIEARERLLEESGGLCVYCSGVATTWDHIIPVSKGGQTTPGNVVPCCASCNSSKKDQDVLEWIDKKELHPLPMLCERIELSAME